MPPVWVLCPSHLGAPPCQGNRGAASMGLGPSGDLCSALAASGQTRWWMAGKDGGMVTAAEVESGTQLCPETPGFMAALGSLSPDTPLWWTEGSCAGRRNGNRG